jgi:UDP-glucuronate 4-epimerase
MNIVITGGAGFIGYHLALSLDKDDHSVICVDNFNDYYDVELKKHRARNLTDRGIQVLKQDVKDIAFQPPPSPYASWLPAQPEKNPDVVVHLAAHAGVRHSLDHPYDYIDNNIVTTQKLIDTCEACQIPKVVYASTSCVMAGQELPWKEDLPTGHQLNPYGWSKRVNECQFKSSNIPCTVGLRFFTVYGPWGRPDMALFTFANQMVSGEELTIYNDGDMVRDFTYIDDIVQGIKLVVLNDQIPDGEIYNIGRGEQVQLMDFVKHIEDNLGIKAKIKYAPKHPADTKETWSSTAKLRELGYDPKVSIGEGVKRFIDWYKIYYGVD